MPASSLTGINVPDSPPTLPEAIEPPFLTASMSIAHAAVEPGRPIRDTPIASTISATESPAAGVAATASASPPSGLPPDTVAPQVAAEAVQAPCDPRVEAVALEDEAAEETTDEADDDETPATLQVEALRILPPDDSDLIVVLDAEAHVGQLSRTAGKAHRQEYRQLFTKLRGN